MTARGFYNPRAVINSYGSVRLPEVSVAWAAKYAFNGFNDGGDAPLQCCPRCPIRCFPRQSGFARRQRCSTRRQRSPRRTGVAGPGFALHQKCWTRSFPRQTGFAPRQPTRRRRCPSRSHWVRRTRRRRWRRRFLRLPWRWQQQTTARRDALRWSWLNSFSTDSVRRAIRGSDRLQTYAGDVKNR